MNNISDQEINILKKGWNDENNNIKKFIINILNNPPDNNKQPYKSISQKLKQHFKGEWFIFVTEKDYEDFDFKFSDINDDQIMVFIYNQFKVYVSKLE